MKRMHAGDNSKMEAETRKKLKNSISFIENTAQNEQVSDQVVTNEWSTIEAQARDLREVIEELETEEEFKERTKKDAPS